MNVEREIERIKALCTPQDVRRAGGIRGSGINAVTVDWARHSLDHIYDNGSCLVEEHEHIETCPDDSRHAHWLDTSKAYSEQLWALLRQDFPENLIGFEYTPETIS